MKYCEKVCNYTLYINIKKHHNQSNQNSDDKINYILIQAMHLEAAKQKVTLTQWAKLLEEF